MPEEYVIACRSYARSAVFPHKTYHMLKENKLLDRLYVFVASEEEKEKYIASLPNFPADRIIVGILGGAKIIEFICNYFPEGQQIVFMDDDLDRFFIFDKDGKYIKDSTNLKKYIEDGFKTIDRFDLGSFTFSFLSNAMFIKGKPFKEFRPFIVAGNFFGTRNSKLIPTKLAHADDALRSSRYFDKYGGTLLYWSAGFATKYGKEEGGLQGSGNRGDAQTRLDLTKRVSEELYNTEELLRVYANPPSLIENAGLYSLRLKHRPQIEKALVERGKRVRKAAWSGFGITPKESVGF